MRTSKEAITELRQWCRENRARATLQALTLNVSLANRSPFELTLMGIAELEKKLDELERLTGD